ncbi:right-handed parallel beta-helix repeat-containing protein [bacterium AH-315-P07]|nr:right-handed parallel beta-helix repeat-containing protein [bacterium AH-315-P07]
MKTPTLTSLFAALTMCIAPMTAAEKIVPGDNVQEQIQEALILAEEGDVIELAAGIFHIKSTLSLDVDNVTLQGAGIDKTILSFAKQDAGSEGLTVTSNGVILKDFAVEDTVGDAIKTKGCKGISFINVRTEWTGGPKSTNGAYGLYPVACENVLIDGCMAIGASDAGIYVGQSRNIIVRNSIAQYNVAGIEIENCYNADVYNNLASHNAGGLLVFDLPNLPQQGGHNVRFFNNKSIDNDTKNFAPIGNIVGDTPTGTGLMIMGNHHVEVFNNEFSGNGTTNILICSYAGDRNEGKKFDKTYIPNPSNIHIHHNQMGRAGYKPMGKYGKIMSAAARSKTLPDVIWDGIVQKGTSVADANISIHDNGSISFINLDFTAYAKSPKTSKPSSDLAPHAKPLPSLPAVRIEGDTASTD